MRRIPILCAFAVIAWAQSPGPPIEASAVNNPTGSGSTITVRNHSASPIVAFSFVFTLRSPDSTVYNASNGYYDSAVDPRQQRPIPPNGSVNVPYYGGQRGLTPVINIEAALFADGTTFGQRNMVQTLMERRNFALVTINKSIGELKQAARDNLTREQLIARMQQAMAEERGAIANNDMAMCILTVRNQVLVDLLNARNPDGTPMPIDKAIAAEIETLTKRKEALK